MKINSKIKSYELRVIEQVLLKSSRDVLSVLKHNRCFYFIDRKVWQLYEQPLKIFVGQDFYFLMDALEENKTYLKLADYYNVLIQARISRNDCLVTIGGGIVQDISGFIASTLYRGIPWVFFPTTLLAQADSCIGSKTSINFGDSKNLIGTFYPPDFIIVDPSFSHTLAASDFNSGLGEIIKFHLLSDEKHYALLKKFLKDGDLPRSPYLQEIIASTLEIKKSYFEQDEFDTGIRNLLNYGHCLGHALESATGFGIAHGEAVIVGMGFANLISRRRNIMNEAVYEEFLDIIQRYYPRFNIAGVNSEDIIRYMKRDKKRVNADLTMILGRSLGDFVKFDDVKEDEVRDAWGLFVQQYPMEKG